MSHPVTIPGFWYKVTGLELYEVVYMCILKVKQDMDTKRTVCDTHAFLKTHLCEGIYTIHVHVKNMYLIYVFVDVLLHVALHLRPKRLLE